MKNATSMRSIVACGRDESVITLMGLSNVACPFYLFKERNSAVTRFYSTEEKGRSRRRMKRVGQIHRHDTYARQKSIPRRP